MLVQFIENAPHTRREGSTKSFQAGKQYVLAADYAQEFIAAGKAKKVVPVTEEDLQQLQTDLGKKRKPKN